MIYYFYMVVTMSICSNSGSSVEWKNPDSNFGFNNDYGYSPLRNNNAFCLVNNCNNIGVSDIGYGGLGYGGIGYSGLGYGGIGINNFALTGIPPFIGGGFPFIGGGFFGY